MTPKQLAAIGQAIYGKQFQRYLATDLQINERTMRRWMAGEWAIPETLRDDLAGIIEKRARTLEKILATLK